MTSPRWRDLGLRAASALVLLPIGIGSIWLGGPVWVVCLTVIIAGLCVEWVLLWRSRAPRTGGDLGILAVGLLYILATYASLLVLRAGASGLRNVLFVMLVVWTGDVGAYLAGRLFGGPRLAPLISPGKTWSGAAGGTLSGVVAGALVAGSHLSHAIAWALVLSVVAQAGDLLESAVKRRFGAKDSGRIIPGHGGLLDRLDGVLAACPMALVCSVLVGPGPLWR